MYESQRVSPMSNNNKLWPHATAKQFTITKLAIHIKEKAWNHPICRASTKEHVGSSCLKGLKSVVEIFEEIRLKINIFEASFYSASELQVHQRFFLDVRYLDSSSQCGLQIAVKDCLRVMTFHDLSLSFDQLVRPTNQQTTPTFRQFLTYRAISFLHDRSV